jgi:capsular exopolysaccharide synthesis family protein
MSNISKSYPVNDGLVDNVRQTEVAEQKEISFAEIIQLIIRRKVGIMVIVLLSMVVSLITFYSLTPHYYADAVMISKAQPSSLTAAVLGGDIVDAEKSANDVELIISLPVSEILVRELWKNDKKSSLELFDYRPYISPVARILGWVLPINSVNADERTVSEGSPVYNALMRYYAVILNERIRVQQTKRSNVFRVSVDSPFPDESAFLTDMLCDVYQKIDIENNTEKYLQSNRFVDQMLKEQLALLDKTDETLSKFMVQNKMYTPEGNTTAWLSQAVTFDSRYNDIMAEYRITMNSRDYLNKNLSEADRELGDRIARNVNAQLGSILEEIRNKESEYISLLKQKSVNDPEVKTKKQEIDQTRSRYEQLSRSKIAGQINYIGQTKKYRYDLIAEKLQLEQKLNNLEYSAREYKRAQQEYESRLTQLPEKEQEFIRLKRDQEVVSQTYMFLKQKLDETRILIGSEVGNISRIGRAFRPVLPDSPKMNKVLLIGLIAGIVLAGVYVMGVEMIDDKVNEEMLFFKSLGFNIWGVIPYVESLEEPTETVSKGNLKNTIGRVFKSVLGKEQVAGLPEGELETSEAGKNFPLMTDKLNSSFAESFRTLRTNLSFSRIDKPFKTILISGCSIGEGKSTVSTNMALAWAIAGKKTLIIDGDLRRPAQHSILKKKRAPGLTDCLASEEEDAEERYIQATHLDNLYLLSSGRPVPNPNELLGSEKMHALIKKLEQRFDRIVIDSPPIFISDAAQLVNTVDGILLTARLHYSSRTPLKEYASDNFLHKRIIGVALIDKPKPSKARYGYGDGRYGYGRYGYGRYSSVYPEKL